MYEAIDVLISASTYISKLDVSIISLDGSYAFQRHVAPELVAKPLPIIVDKKTHHSRPQWSHKYPCLQ